MPKLRFEFNSIPLGPVRTLVYPHALNDLHGEGAIELVLERPVLTVFTQPSDRLHTLMVILIILPLLDGEYASLNLMTLQ